MARKILALLLSLCMAAGLMGTAWATGGSAPTAAVSDNNGAQNYATWSTPMRSYLYEDEDDHIVRVEALRDNTIIVEEYSEDYELLSSRTVPMELTIFGGFFAGEDYNFLVFGDTNRDQSQVKEVCRVVKYSKDWKRLDETNLQGINTTVMFDAGSCRMTEAMGYLFVRTSHEMYKSEDGVNHQANVTFSVNEKTMEVGDLMADVANPAFGYVSHSFNQFILIDYNGAIVTLDHGDGGPRDLTVLRYRLKADSEDFTAYGVEGNSVCHMVGGIGENYTGASVGGFSFSNSHYLAAYNLDGQTGSHQSVRNIKVGAVPKDDLYDFEQGYEVPFTGTSITLTNYPADGNTTTSTPQMVKLDDKHFLVLWQIYDLSTMNGEDTISYAYVDGEGQLIGSVRSIAGALSDCQPIVVDGEAVWYVTSNSTPVFYILGERGLRTVRTIPDTPAFSDVPQDHWAYDHVQNAYRHNVVAGSGTDADGNLIFNPNGTVTLAQFSVMLANAAYPDEVAGKTMDNWYNRQVEVLEAHGIYTGIESPVQADVATRSEMAMMVYNLMVDLGEDIPDREDLEATSASIPDLNTVPSAYQTAVCTCYYMGIINGVPGKGFDGAGEITRGTMAAIYTNMAKALEAF